jgi:hypothetical protein
LLSYFRINDPYRLLGAFIILILINLPRLFDDSGLTYPELKSMLIGEKLTDGSSLYGQLMDYTAPLTSWVYALVDYVGGRSILFRQLLTLFIIFTQAAFLSLILNDKKVFPENTYIPALIYVVAASFSFDMLALSGAILGAGFMLLAFNSLLREMEFRDHEDATFKIGFFVSMASLCLFSYSLFLIGILFMLSMFTRSTWQKYLLLLLGYLMPHVFVATIYYLNNNLEGLWDNYYLPNLAFGGDAYFTTTSFIALAIIPIGYLIISFLLLSRDAHFTKYQSNIVTVMFMWLFFGMIQIYYAKEFRPQSFVVLLPVIAFYVTHFFLLIKRRRFAEINAWIFIGGIIAIGYLAQYQKISLIDYGALRVKPITSEIKDKSILILDHDFSLYNQNRLGSGLLTFSLVKKVISAPDYYENIMMVNQSFNGSDLPEIIMDPHDYMDPLLIRIPRLKAMYEKSSPGVYTLR